LTVAPVPSGMNAGVRMIPRGVEIAPVRAAPSRALTWKEKFAGVSDIEDRGCVRWGSPKHAKPAKANCN